MPVVRTSQTARSGLAFLLFLLCQLPPYVAEAGRYSVSPHRVKLSAESPVAALRVHNNGSELVSVQVELLDWMQRDGVDTFETNRDVLVTPPIFTVPPGETQVIRVGLRRPPDPERELNYRLFLQELPPPLPDNFQGLRVVSRASLPVFVQPAAGEAAPKLRWRVQRIPDGKLLVTARNTGNGHGRVTGLHLLLADGREISIRGYTYILPESVGKWSITSANGRVAAGSELVLTAKVNGNEISIQQRVE